MKKLLLLIIGLTTVMVARAQYNDGTIALPLGSGRTVSTPATVKANTNAPGGLVNGQVGNGYTDGTVNLPMNGGSNAATKHVSASGQKYNVSYSGNASYSAKALHQSGTIHFYGGGTSAGSTASNVSGSTTSVQYGNAGSSATVSSGYSSAYTSTSSTTATGNQTTLKRYGNTIASPLSITNDVPMQGSVMTAYGETYTGSTEENEDPTKQGTGGNATGVIPTPIGDTPWAMMLILVGAMIAFRYKSILRRKK